jgi:C4-type Zn-finger protein
MKKNTNPPGICRSCSIKCECCGYRHADYGTKREKTTRPPRIFLAEES